MANNATIDFESRSACNIKKTGSWKYSLDPSTEVLCMAFRLPHWKRKRVALWHPAFPHLGIPEADCLDDLRELFYWILSGGLVEAHNAWFERGMWANVLVPRFGWPAVAGSQWRCSAAKAAAHALPRGLDDACHALGLSIRKDAAGHKLMLKMSKPRKPRKKEVEAWRALHGNKPMPLLWHEDKDLLRRLWAYCKQDVLAEEAVSHAVPELKPSEAEMYSLDQKINERGFLLDRDAFTVALSLIDSQTSTLNAELKKLTGGSPSRATQRAQLQNWFAQHWFVLEDTKALSVETALKEIGLAPTVKRGLELLQLLGRASTAKYEAMRNWACPDSRVRGGLLFHGASTGRWSGAGVQPHNFPKGEIKDIEGAWAAIKSMDIERIKSFPIGKKQTPVGDVLKLLSQALRGAIIAPSGKKLFVADYAGIEARVLLWLAGDEDALEMFRRGEDIYCAMASAIYKREITPNPESQPPERALGKIAVLGLGYQMGWAKFVATCALFGIVISDDLAQQTVEAYRTKFSKVKQLWYDIEAAAIRAVRSGEAVTVGCVTWKVEGRFLYCTLPSGRRLAYAEPAVRIVTTSWGAQKAALTYKGVNPKTHQWQRQPSYGGLLVENLVQAISRDIMAEAMLRLEDSLIYAPILSVHDELISEANEHLGDIHEYEKLVATIPKWARGCPIEVEGWAGVRYRK